MAELGRTPDFLQQHTHLGRRVTNLETGVHPTMADLDYWDSYGPDNLTILGGIFDERIAHLPKVSRRTGMTYFGGSIEGVLDGVDDTTGELIAQVAIEYRPPTQQIQMVAISVNPFYVRISVEANGEVRLFRGNAVGQCDVFLDNIAYPAISGTL